MNKEFLSYEIMDSLIFYQRIETITNKKIEYFTRKASVLREGALVTIL